MKKQLVFVWTVLVLLLPVYAQQTKTQEATDERYGMEGRGDQAMGFSHEKTTHHFRLYKDGGAIEVSANDAKDTDSRNMIRMHLSHIAQMFAEGAFDTPMFIHSTTPPGVATMKGLRDQISYQYLNADNGGRVRIRSANSRAVAAVHDFLRFQIAEHKTGDAAEIAEEKKTE